MNKFEDAVLEIVKTEEFQDKLAYQLATLLIEIKFYEQDEEGYRSKVKRDIDEELAKIGKESIAAAIKRCLESQRDVRQIVVDSLVPEIGKVIDEAISRRSK